tara:strand:- start:65 stop:367 length:303 start_codon:yes stop_codon:yes gene_type:complete
MEIIELLKLKDRHRIIKEYDFDTMAEVEAYRKGVDDYHTKQLRIGGVSSSFNLEIKDRDIATIEAMHDTLLDEKILGLNARSMKESRALTQRMYKALSKD